MISSIYHNTKKQNQQKLYNIHTIYTVFNFNKQGNMQEQDKPEPIHVKSTKIKLTLTQLKRYLPLLQPTCTKSYPPLIARYLLSPQFSNLSISQQKVIESKYKIIYRNYYGIEDIVQYIDQLTKSKYAKNSIRRAICNTAQRYGVVDWYKIVRIVMRDSLKTTTKIQKAQLGESNEGQQANIQDSVKIRTVNSIKKLFKNYLQKRIVWKGVEQVADTQKNLEPKVLIQLIKQVVNQVKEHIQKNRIASEKLLYEYQQKYTKINFIILEQLVNRKLQLYMDRKKCIYFYLHFDEINKGYFPTSLLLSQLLVIKKIKPPKILPQFMVDSQEIYEQIRSQFNVIFQSAADLKENFYFLCEQQGFSGEEENAQPAPEQYITSNLMYKFISKNLNNRYSHYQSDLVLKKIQYFANIHFLFNKPKPLQLGSLILKLASKNKSSRKKLKKQNQIFYSYRQIILNLLSKINQPKITKERFKEFIEKIDPKLKSNSFYCVWRVYPSIINIKRMLELSRLNKFACYLKLKKRNQQEYFKIYEQLIDQYPQGTTVMYEKVEEKINLTLEFMLQNSKIKLDKYGRYDQVDYRKTIQEILQPDFEIIMRKYIFTKIAEKAYALWKYRKNKMRALMIVDSLRNYLVRNQSKNSLDSKIDKKMSTQKSKASLKSKKQPKIDPQSLEIAKWNLQKIIDQLNLSQKYRHRQFHKDKHQQKYVYRTMTPRFSVDNIMGIVGMGQELMFLKNNKSEIIKTKFLYKPGIQIIDFLTTTSSSNTNIIILTSYFTLQFYNFSQNTNYSYKTIQLLNQVEYINNSILDDICQDRLFSKYPIFIRTYNSLIIANTTIINNKILIVNCDSDAKQKQIIIKQKQHIFTKTTQKIFQIIKKSKRCGKIVNQIIRELVDNSGVISEGRIREIFLNCQVNGNMEQSHIGQQVKQFQQSKLMQSQSRNKLQQQQIYQQQLFDFLTQKQLKQFSINLKKYQQTSLNILLLKQQFELLTPRKVPKSLEQVLTTLRNQLLFSNTSLLDMLVIIDREQEGIVKMKAFKDYLLKITQEVYLMNQKEIDSYLREICVGKNVTYEGICQIMIMSHWDYKIWQRPRMIIRDFIYQQQCQLLIYTIQGQLDVYIRNVNDHSIVGILKQHQTTPHISYIPQSMMLITGDNNAIRIWRLFQDFINKYDENPPWEINPIYILRNAHEATITSISYLPRAHCLVTTSLDSTAKFWKFISTPKQQKQKQQQKIQQKLQLKQQKQTIQQKQQFTTNTNKSTLYLKQQIRLYSQQHYYLNSKPNIVCLTPNQSNNNISYQTICLQKINKQINQNNKYKLQCTIQSYHIQHIKLETGMQNIYIDKLPQKLINQMSMFTNGVLAKKKKILYQKWAKDKQIEIERINLVSRSLQRGLYQAVKKYYIFGNQKELGRIAQFLEKKSDKGFMIYKILFEEYGLVVANRKNNAPIISIFSNQKNNKLNQNLRETSIQSVTMAEDELKTMFKLIQNSQKNKGEITYEKLKNIVQDYLFGSQYQKFEQIMKKYIKQKNKQTIKIADLPKYFIGYPLESDIDRFYVILRNLQIILKKSNKKIWQIFVNNKKQLQKKAKINTRLFTLKMKQLSINSEHIRVMLSFLARNDEVSLHELIYYMKIAYEAMSLDLSASNFSAIFLENSMLLKTRLNKFLIQENPSLIKQETFQEKILKLQNSRADSSNKIDPSRKSSSKKLKSASRAEDNAESGGDKSDRNRSRSHSKKQEIVELRSHHMSSSGSRLTITRSYTKDTISRQAHIIIKKMKQLFKNQNKSIWDIVSLTIPDFMQNSIITQTQYFNIFKALNSPVYLADKIKLLNFILRQEEDNSSTTSLNLNILFQLFQSTHHYNAKSKTPPILPGQKYIFNHIITKLTENKMKLQHSITKNFFPSQEQQQPIEQILKILSKQPFSLLSFCLRQMQLILITQNKSTFVTQQIYRMITEKIIKYKIKVEVQQIGYIDQLIYRVQIRNQQLEELLPKQATTNNNSKLNFPIFKNMIKNFFMEKDNILENQFIKIITKNYAIQKDKSAQKQLSDNPSKLRSSPTKKLSNNSNLTMKNNSSAIGSLNHGQIIRKQEIKYKDFIKVINMLIQQLKIEASSEKDALRKFIKCLQLKKINLLAFFISLDPNHNYYINQAQFVAGLAELKISQNFWKNINKKYQKRLYYNQLIKYLIQKGAVDYKCVDSQLQAAMSKFLRRFVRNDDIEAVYDRIRAKDSQESYNVTYESFNKAIKSGNLFQQKQIFYIFSAFVNAENMKHSKFSNDDIIKDQTNIKKTFNFKMFTDIIHNYKNQNITKTPLYRLCDWIRKRNISILNQFIKWMERNKKIKQVGEALKNKQNSLPKPIFQIFVKDFNSGLNEKQLKELLNPFPPSIDFSVFNQKLEQIYKKGNDNIASEEVSNFLRIIYKKIQELKVSAERLYKDFTKNFGFMKIADFSNIISFMEIGFTKIQIRQIFQAIDLEKKGYITLSELQDSLQQAGQSLQRQNENLQLQNILEKITLNRDKFSLKASRIQFSYQRACIVFQKILTSQQTDLLYNQSQQYLKVNQLTEQKMEEYIRIKQVEARSKKDKKYKQLILKFLNFLKKVNLEVSEAYHYFANDTNSLNKNKFLILYQSLQLKSNILEINSLYSFLDETKSGVILINKWQDKLNMIQFQNQKDSDQLSGTVPEEQLQVFYKVKLFLSEVYLVFIRKLFKNKQIYAYFDLNGKGVIGHQQFISSLTSLGLNIDENMQKRVVNYLDRNKNGEIQISAIVHQLQNCLASKSKLILETKTSCIFKSKVDLIQQKQQYFIEKLVAIEHFLQIKDKIHSCILKTQFMGMIRDFGIILGQDEINDIQRNFGILKDNLLLYPLYFMFINIFKGAEFTFSAQQMQRKRFQKLFQTMVKSNITLKIFQRIKTSKQAINFLTQLKIFTPIQIKLLVQKIIIPQTSLIDKNQLAYHLRNSYLSKQSATLNILHTNQSLFKNQSFMNMSNSQKLQRQLKTMVNPTEVVEILKATTGKVNYSTFTQLLNKMNLVFTRNQNLQFFKAFAQNKQYIMLENLIGTTQEQLAIETELIKSQFQVTAKNNKYLQNNQNANKSLMIFSQQQKYQQNLIVLLNHIAKQLDFKGISLGESWEKYYYNFGYITHQAFRIFLEEIGFEYKEKGREQYKDMVDELERRISKETNQKEIKRFYFEGIMRKYGQYPNKPSKTEKYFLNLKIYQHLIQNLLHHNKINTFIQQLKQFILEQSGRQQTITINILYLFLNKYLSSYKNYNPNNIISNSSFNNYVKFIAMMLMRKKQEQTEVFIKQFRKKLIAHRDKKVVMKQLQEGESEEQEGQIIVKDPSAALLETKQAMQLTDNLMKNLQLIKVCEHNFIWNYQQQIMKLQVNIQKVTIPIQNLHRIAGILLCEQILGNMYLLELKPNFNKNIYKQIQEQQKKSNIGSGSRNMSKSISLPALNSLIIDNQEYLEDRGIYQINSKYHGLSISQASNPPPEKIFQSLYHATKLLQPSYKFYRAKNYYLWQPLSSNDKMPKTALNYRWKYIPTFIVTLAKQFQSLQSDGRYSIPHFRYDGLSKTGITELRFANKIDQNGNYLEEIIHKELIKIDDPYSAPQIFMNISRNSKMTNKINLWVFGCLLYQFVWGHAPQSFVMKVLGYIKDRSVDIEASKALKLKQLPSDFIYTPFDFQKIQKLLQFQHQLKSPYSFSNYMQNNNNTQHSLQQQQDYQQNIKYLGYRGLIKQLQILYGDELMYYKEQIKLFENIMLTIQQCLNPLPELRPKFETIIQQYQKLQNKNISGKINGDKSIYMEYLDVLQRNKQCYGVYEDIAQPLMSQYRNSYSNNNSNNNNSSNSNTLYISNIDTNSNKSNSKLNKIIKKLQKLTKQCLQSKKIKQIFVIPKYYPWPATNLNHNYSNIVQSPTKQIQPQIYQQTSLPNLVTNTFNKQLSSHKNKLRANQHYNILSFLLNQNCYEILINLCIRSKQQQLNNKNNKQKQQQMFDHIFQMLFRVLESIRDYDAMLTAYIPNILEGIVQLVFEQEFRFVVTSNQGEEGGQYTKGKLNALELTKCKKKWISRLERIIYVNGTANIEYLPINHYFKTNQQFPKLFQAFYCTIKLQSQAQHEQYLAMNYFMDQIDHNNAYKQYKSQQFEEYQQQYNEGELWEIMRYFRVDMIVMKILTKVATIGGNAEYLRTLFRFVKKLGENNPLKNSTIFSTQIFYLQLHRFLCSSNIYPDSVTIKTTILQILTTIIQTSQYSLTLLRNITSPAYNILRQILRMLIQPSNKLIKQNLYDHDGDQQNNNSNNMSVEYQEYINMVPVLYQLIDTIQSNRKYSDVIRKIEGAEFIIDAFKNKARSIL